MSKLPGVFTGWSSGRLEEETLQGPARPRLTRRRAILALRDSLQRFFFKSPNRSLLSQNSSGFTLIEVLISIAILVVISMSIYQATTQTYKLRDTVVHEGDFYNGIRLAMGVIERDIQLAYSPLIMRPPEKKAPPGNNGQGNIAPPPTDPTEQLRALGRGDLLQQSQYWAPALDATGLRPMRFQGDRDKMSFVTLSNVRIYRETRQSEFLKVAYSLMEDKISEFDKRDKVEKPVALVRRSSTRAFTMEDERDPDAQTNVILRGIQKIRFRYYHKRKDEWRDRWDSDTADVLREYPDLVEVTLEVAGPARLRHEGIYLLRTEVPLRGIQTRF